MEQELLELAKKLGIEMPFFSQELLSALCGYLPYGVFVEDSNGVRKLTVDNTDFADLFNGKCNIKPFLRPLSSMTDDELAYLKKLAHFGQKGEIYFDDGVRGLPIYQLDDANLNDIFRFMFDYGFTILVDWLNSNHFDYRGLIEKGLANKATEGMYEIISISK